MESTSNEIHKVGFDYQTIRGFPPVEDGKINLLRFLDAASDLLSLIGK